GAQRSALVDQGQQMRSPPPVLSTLRSPGRTPATARDAPGRRVNPGSGGEPGWSGDLAFRVRGRLHHPRSLGRSRDLSAAHLRAVRLSSQENVMNVAALVFELWRLRMVRFLFCGFLGWAFTPMSARGALWSVADRRTISGNCDMAGRTSATSRFG